MSWKDTITSALRPRPHTEEMNDYERVTREVVEFVNGAEPAMRVVVRSRYVADLLRLDVLTCPTRRPAERSIMISMAADASGTMWVPTPAGLGPLKDRDPETLRTYLVEFFSSPNFVATVGHYRVRNEEPVEAWLKRVDYRKVDLADVALMVVGTEQDKLVAAFESSNFTQEVEIIADLVSPVGNFRAYDPKGPYAMLDSGGFVLQVVRHTPVGATGVRVGGVPRADLDWRTGE